MSKHEQISIRLGPGQVPRMVQIDPHLVALCRDFRDAIRLCMNHSHVKRTDAVWAALCGMTAGSFSCLLNQSGGRKRNPDPELFVTIQQEAGNTAINQFFEMQTYGELNHQRSKSLKRAELLKQLEALEAE